MKTFPSRIYVTLALLVALTGSTVGEDKPQPKLPADLKLVSADAHLFMTFNVQQLWKTEAAKLIRKRAAEELKELQVVEETFGMKVTDLKRVTFVGLTEVDLADGDVFVIVLAKKPFDQKKIIQAGNLKEVTLQKKKYYEVPGDTAVYFAGRKIAVVGPPTGVETFLRHKIVSEGPLREWLFLAGKKHHLVLGNTLSEETKKTLRAAGNSDPLIKIMVPLLDVISSAWVINVKKDIEIEWRGRYPTEEKAKAAKAGNEELFKLLREKFAPELEQMPAPVRTAMRALLRTKTTQSRSTLKQSITIRDSVGFTRSILDMRDEARLEAAKISMKGQLKQLALAMHSYADANNGKLPPAVIRDKKGKPLYSWRVELLPYLEEQELYNQFRRDEPWDSPNNIKLLDKMPKVLEHSLPDVHKSGKTPFQVFTGDKTVFLKLPLSLQQITNLDGTSNTLLIVESKKLVPWTAPQDLVYSEKVKPLTQVGGHFRGGFLAVFCDGSVFELPSSMKEKRLRLMIMPGDGQRVGPAD